MKTEFVVDEKNKKIYADIQALSKKDVAKVDKYISEGYELVNEPSEQGFIAPHNMGIQQSNASAFPMM